MPINQNKVLVFSIYAAVTPFVLSTAVWNFSFFLYISSIKKLISNNM